MSKYLQEIPKVFAYFRMKSDDDKEIKRVIFLLITKFELNE